MVYEDPNYHKEYYITNKERIKKQLEEWKKKNPNYHKERYKKNKEEMDKRSRDYYKNNKEKVKTLMEKWKKKNPNYHKEYSKRYSKTPKARLYRKLYVRKHRRIINLRRILKKYNLSYQEYKDKTDKCSLCGFNKYRVDIHHIDEDSNNNSKDNLIGVCPNCHLGIHRGKIKEI